ncbi:MAG: histidine kinase, partial [Rhodothermia bacterium]|nr:histidine kinase [Rhodothermia bacterium]
IVPLVQAVTESTVGWLVVGVQLMSTVPVILVSLTTLRYGRLDRVVSRGLTYVAVLGLIFFAFVGIKGLIDPWVASRDLPVNIVSGLLVVVLLLIFERVAMRAREYFSQFFATDRERAARLIDRLQERIRDFVDINGLLRESVHVVGKAFDVRSAVLFVQTSEDPEMWTSASYRPQPPYLTERAVRSLWPHFRVEAAPWAFNPELNLSHLPAEKAMILVDRGAVLAVPIKGKDQPVGLLVLGRKTARRAVYNVEDLDRLRSFARHLALAIERLELVEKQKELVRQSSEAQMMALRAQINPHFLFNALNTIAASIDERPDLAESTVENLAHIFRYTLQTGNKPFVTLENEISLVRNYLDIEQARFGSRLRVTIDIESGIGGFLVPAFAVQTLVENAVKHGIEKGRNEGHVTIAAQKDRNGVMISVADSGIGIPALFESNPDEEIDTSFFGIGLRNVTARLEYLYGRVDLFRIVSRPGDGTVAILRLPDAAQSERYRDAESRHPRHQDLEQE